MDSVEVYSILYSGMSILVNSVLFLWSYFQIWKWYQTLFEKKSSKVLGKDDVIRWITERSFSLILSLVISHQSNHNLWDFQIDQVVHLLSWNVPSDILHFLFWVKQVFKILIVHLRKWKFRHASWSVSCKTIFFQFLIFLFVNLYKINVVPSITQVPLYWVFIIINEFAGSAKVLFCPWR